MWPGNVHLQVGHPGGCGIASSVTQRALQSFIWRKRQTNPKQGGLCRQNDTKSVETWRKGPGPRTRAAGTGPAWEGGRVRSSDGFRVLGGRCSPESVGEGLSCFRDVSRDGLCPTQRARAQTVVT